MATGIPCTWMRGGTSKGAYFLKQDLPQDENERNALLLQLMGSPDPRQIDGIGGADPLTSKVAVISKSDRPGVDIDYLFLQVFVDRPIVTDKQNCGNILAGVGPFAIERGMVVATPGKTELSIFMVNSSQIATVTLDTPEGEITYLGDAAIDGVPGTAAPVLENFPDAMGSTCGALLPTGNVVDVFDGVAVTCIDNGMPVVLMRAADLGISGYETRQELDANETLKVKLEAIRLLAGGMMNLDDVSEKPIPKMTLIAPPQAGGAICSRTFIPHRCHASIGVLGAVSVATACVLPGSVAAELVNIPEGQEKLISVEHPIGEMSVLMDVSVQDQGLQVHKAAVLRTARKLFEGYVFEK